MAEETDEFGIPIRKAATSQAEVDEFGIPVKKKEPTTKSPEVTTSVSQQPVEQPTKPLQESGANRNLLQEAQQLFGDQNKSEEQFQQGINPAAANYFERKRTERKEGVTTEEKLSVKNKDLTALRTEAAENYYSLDKNSQYPAVEELKKLYTQANELAKQQKDNSGVIAQIEAIRNQPVDDSWRKAGKIQVSESQAIEVPQLIKSAYKNNGELYDATVDFYNKYAESDTKAKALYEQMKPEIEQLRVEETYKPTGTDEQGNEYMAQNPVKAFVENASQSMESLAITLKSLNPAYSKEEIIRDMDIKNLRDNVLFPQKAETAFAKGAGMLGGVTPLVAGAALSGGGLGAVAMNTLLFGAQGYGGKLYESYITEKMNNPTMPDDEAYEIAKGNAKVAAGIQGALGATMPVQGAIGRKLFLNSAEKGAVKTFLAEQGIMVPAFGGATVAQNLIEGKEAKTGVVESMEDAFIIGAMLHTIGNVPKLSAKIRTTFENGVAKNYEQLSTVINDAVDAGVLDFSTAQNLVNRAKAFDVVGKENPPKVENELVDLGMQLNDLSKEIDRRTNANPLSDVSDLEVQAEEVNRQILEKKGTPLTEKERKEYEKIVQKRDAVGKEGEKAELLPTEKDRLKHFEKRIEQGGKNEANKIAQEQGFDSATHLLNSIEKAGLGKYEKVQDIPEGTVDKLFEFPIPEKPLSEMAATEVRDYSKRLKQHERNLGKLDESKLTKEQADKYFGRDLPEGEYDPYVLDKIANRMEGVEVAENAEELAQAATPALLELIKERGASYPEPVLKAIARRAKELGISPEEILRQVQSKIGKNVEPAERDFLINEILKKLTGGEVTETGVRPDETTATTETTAIEPTGETATQETTVLQEGEKPVAEEITTETIKPEVKDSFAQITDLFYKIREASGSSKKRSLKEQRDKILEENPSIKYIDDNISSVLKQLEEKGLITKKGDCP